MQRSMIQPSYDDSVPNLVILGGSNANEKKKEQIFTRHPNNKNCFFWVDRDVKE
jgi:hypothetical protein